MKVHFNFRYFLFIIVVLIGCQDDIEIRNERPVSASQFLHLSHTRLDSNPLIDLVATEIDFNRFDVVMLGGDLAQASSADIETMTHLDSVFNLSDESTLWSLGNHDYSVLDLIEDYTGRPSYFTYNTNGITFLILDTQDSLSHIVSEQLDFFNSVVDTIEDSSHLILLSHKLFWMPGNEALEPTINQIANGEFGSCGYCTNPSNFYQDLYPSLVELEQSGIEVISLGGDIGTFEKSFSFQTKEGIDYLASGIESGEMDNQALVFYHQRESRELSWEFVPIEDL